jgi:hypothetical protein
MPYAEGQVRAEVRTGASKVKAVDQLKKRTTVAAANPKAATAA